MSKFAWLGPFHENATWLPSGESEGSCSTPGSVVSGINLMFWATGTGRLLVHRQARAARTSADPATATIHANRRRFVVAINAIFVLREDAVFVLRFSRASFRSDAVCHRFEGSFARHRS